MALLAYTFHINCGLLFCLVWISKSIISDAQLSDKTVDVVFSETETFSHTANSKFLSVALDSALIANGFLHFNISDPKLVRLMEPLSPGYLRIGGNMADRLWFDPHDKYSFKTRQVIKSDGGACANEEIMCDFNDWSNFTMSATEWTQLNQLAQKSGLTILFDLNCLIRYPNGSWNSKNAEELIKFSADRKFGIIWQLGNEPNAFRHVFNYEVNATQLAEDFGHLRKILDSYAIYNKSMLVGPDTTRPIARHKSSTKYLHDFLLKGKNVIDAITWHQYYFSGRNATESQFLDPNVFNLLETQISDVKDVVKTVGATGKPIWLGETSSAYGGGAPGLSNTFLATFIWLDKLGAAARSGLDLVVRQSLFGSYYSLLDKDFRPLPDWWVSVIYKTIVHSRVAPCNITSSSSVRLYCHCTKKRLFGFYSPFIVVFGLNVGNTQARVRIHEYNGYVWKYSLTADGSLVSKNIQLNGKTLRVTSDGNLPDLEPTLVSANPYLHISPHSLVFWIIPLEIVSCISE